LGEDGAGDFLPGIKFFKLLIHKYEILRAAKYLPFKPKMHIIIGLSSDALDNTSWTLQLAYLSLTLYKL